VAVQLNSELRVGQNSGNSRGRDWAADREKVLEKG